MPEDTLKANVLLALLNELNFIKHVSTIRGLPVNSVLIERMEILEAQLEQLLESKN